MNRTNPVFLRFVGAVLLLAAWFASGWLATRPCPDRAFLSGLCAAAVILGNGVLLFFLNERVMTGASLLVFLFYIVLSTANPSALYFSRFHAASLLLAGSFACYVRFNALNPSMENLCGAWLLLGIAALLEPPFLWLAPVYALTSAGKAENKPKFIAATLLFLILPAAAWIGFRYLKGEASPALSFLESLWDGMTALRKPSFQLSAPTLCRILVTAIACVLAAVRILRRLDSYRISQFRASIRLIVMTLSLCLIVAFFYAGGSPGDSLGSAGGSAVGGVPSGLVVLLPVSLMLGEYTGPSRSRPVGRTMAAFLLLFLLAERISCFV